MEARNDPLVLAKRALDHCNAGTTDQAPSTYEVPVTAYYDPERYRKEWEAAFLRNPLPLALSIELPENGTYKAMTIMEKPVLLTRGKDGVARAFFNVCSHRGAAVCPEGTGKQPVFVCPYHSWSFNTQGKLVGVHAARTFGDIDKSKMGLTELPCAERAGLVFVCLTPGQPMDIDEWLGDFKERLESLGLQNYHLFHSHYFSGPIWKVATDGYLEVYHHQTVHGQTVGDFTIGNLLVHDTFGPHQRLIFGRKSLPELNEISPENWDASAYFDHTRTTHNIFPNTWIGGVKSGFVSVGQVFPGPTPGENLTRLTVLCAKKPETEEEIASAQAFCKLVDQALRVEDYGLGASIQKCLTTGALDHLTFGRNEPGVQHYHKTLSQLSGVDNLTSVSMAAE